MTNPRDPDAPDGAPDGKAALDTYVEQNSGRYTDEALLAALVQAGHNADDVRSALARATARDRPGSVAPRAVGIIIAAHVGTFLVLAAGMLANADQDRGHLMPDAAGGIGILFWSLAVVFALSLVWVASRRAFAIVAVIGIAIVILGSAGLGAIVVPLVLAGVIAGIWLLIRGARGTAHAQVGLATLLVVPMLGLVVVGGICVASGLPIPQPG